ncbi:beta-ketoacyl synthase N-terminal-like domain-containing protein [Skermania sp. ID1734]|uniref:beta-ketoacyl synthase N-terminal-like domain-containing protein n=1 Tax=Skermania sp. ID1734 TaxID=2597516 RepID=UPI00163D4DA5|nr:beta-ketoacyl synthase N-terminal-like domain-containing protein [Skermania sp. ID1734]
MADDRRAGSGAIAIVGVGAVFPGAADAAAYWRNIVDGVDAISAAPANRWDPSYYRPELPPASDRLYCRRGGFIDDLATFDAAGFGIMPVAAAGGEPDQMLALRVAAETIADAGGADRLTDRSRVGVILGRGGYLSPAGVRLDQRVRTAHQLVATLRELVPGLGADELDRVRQAFQDKLGPERPEAAIGLVPNLAASRIANRLDLQGPAYTIDAACASSLVAVDQAIGELTSGRCDLVLAGGVHHTHDITFWSVFTQLGALSRSEQIRPFHRGADGLLIGEGTGMVALKRLADAERDGDRVYAVIRGSGVSSDGRASTLMAPRMQGQVLALTRAWQAAGLDPTADGALGLLEAHGTATPAGDQAELATLTEVFGGGQPTIGLGSVKSMIGHTMPAAGIAGLIKAALAVHHAVLPPTLHCDDPHPGFADSRFYPLTDAQPWDSPIRRAAVDAFGFGGINAHVIIEQPPGAAASVGYATPDPAEKILLLAAATPDELARQLDVEDARLIDAAGGTPGAGTVRLAVIAPDARRLALARKVVARGKPWYGRNDIYFAPQPLATRPDQVAFVFPGLEPEPVGRPSAELTAHFGLEPIEWRTGDHFVDHAINLLRVSRCEAAALAQLGIRPGALAGHSLGEWTAMLEGGMFSAADADEFMTALEGGQVPDLIYAAAGCSADDAASALGDLLGPDGVVVTHDNCPHQSVICGHPERIDAAIARLLDRGVLAQVVPIRSGFHSPMLESHLSAAHKGLDHLPPRPARLPVWSATTVAPFPADPDEVRELVLRHLIERVRFRPMIERMHDTGIRVFVQVGPGSLPGFVEDTLRGREHLTVASNAPGRGALDQLRRVGAALWAAGLRPRLDRLPGEHREGSPRSPGMRLDLGSPLVRLDGTVPPVTLASVPDAVGHSDPILAELDALVADVSAGSREILAAWRAREPRPVATAPRALTCTEVVSLQTMPELLDHSIIGTPPGWPDATDRFPVVPMTSMLELMAQAAARLAPGAKLIGWTKVRALRWLAAAPATTVTIRAEIAAGERNGETSVEVTIEGHATGTVLFADAYPSAPAPSTEPLAGERPPTVTAAQLYERRHMFHGSRFAGIAELTADADRGVRAVLRNLPTRGTLFDAVGQVIGHWAQQSLAEDRMVFPSSIDAIRLYGPMPAAGALLRQTAWIREIGPATMRSDSELVEASGAVFARVEGWTNIRIGGNDRTWQMQLRPDAAGLADVQDGGWCLVQEFWADTRTREITMRSFMNATERAEYERLDPMHQRQWLLGRIAAKDAVRQTLWDSGRTSVFCCEVTVGRGDDGRATVAAAGLSPQTSLAFANTACRGRDPGLGVALVGTGFVAIGIEPVAGDEAAAAVVAATRAISEALGGDPQLAARASVDGSDIAVAVSAGEKIWQCHARPVQTGGRRHVVAWCKEGIHQ